MDRYNRRWVIVGVVLLFLLTVTLLGIAGRDDSRAKLFVTDSSTATPEPIVPTRTRTSITSNEHQTQEPAGPSPAATTAPSEPTATPTPVPSATVEAGETAVPTVTASPALIDTSGMVASELARFGISIARSIEDAEAAYAAGLPFGSTQNWNVRVVPPAVPADYWQMVRINQEGIRRVSWEQLDQAIAANPGSNWLVGNEPDVVWQDNVTPERYGEIYHDVYTFIKERDPAAQIAIGGVSQPTPLRRAYLDIVLDTYQEKFGEPMPIDIWNVHAFTLREEADSWGVGIPPGMEGQEGILYEIEDHDDVDIIAQNLRDFRGWMADRGYGDRPLVISEYGILMPEDYGFPPHDVAAFLTSTFDLFREMAGEEGYAPDDNRLVQWWFWYSVYDKDLYSTGNLWDEETGQLTELGQTWTQYVTDNNIATDTGN